MLQVTIAKLMALVVFMAVGLVALSRPSPEWASFVFSASLTALLTSLLGVIASRGRSRIGAVGFALFGWSHLLMSFGPWPWLNNEGLRPPQLFTKHLARTAKDGVLRKYLAPNPMNLRTITKWSDAKLVPHEPSQFSFGAGTGPFVMITDSPSDQILQSLCSVLFGCLGAVLGLVVGSRSGREGEGDAGGRTGRPPDSASGSEAPARSVRSDRAGVSAAVGPGPGSQDTSAASAGLSSPS